MHAQYLYMYKHVWFLLYACRIRIPNCGAFRVLTRKPVGEGQSVEGEFTPTTTTDSTPSERWVYNIHTVYWHGSSLYVPSTEEKIVSLVLLVILELVFLLFKRYTWKIVLWEWVFYFEITFFSSLKITHCVTKIVCFSCI